jgi:transposase
VERTRRRFVEEGLEAALSERPRPGAAPALDQKGRATLLALACSNPPEGRTCWTMQLLADELVERQVWATIRSRLSAGLQDPIALSSKVQDLGGWPGRA